MSEFTRLYPDITTSRRNADERVTDSNSKPSVLFERYTNIADPDQTPQIAMSDQGPYCLLAYVNLKYTTHQP